MDSDKHYCYNKDMFHLDIPGYGHLDLEYFVTDYSGTLSEDGSLLAGIKEKLNDLSEKLHLHVLTSDTFGKAKDELIGIQCTLHVLGGNDHTKQKEKYVVELGADKVVAFGNGNNDVGMLKAARVGIAVCLKEGCSSESIKASEILVRSPIDAIDLFLFPKRLIATLRR
jgi:soluble P-type ATPase